MGMAAVPDACWCIVQLLSYVNLECGEFWEEYWNKTGIQTYRIMYSQKSRIEYLKYDSKWNCFLRMPFVFVDCSEIGLRRRDHNISIQEEYVVAYKLIATFALSIISDE